MRALIVAYLFPPTGGAGVARMAKLVKYLPAHGIAPSVLTASNPSVPEVDRSRERDLPPDLEIVRVRTFEPGYAVKRAAWAAQSAQFDAAASKGRHFDAIASLKRGAVALAKQALIPDPQILWQPAAQVALARRLARRSDDAVLVSGPPFSQFLLAPAARLAGAGLVLDYRDEWSTYRETYEMMGGLGAFAGARLEAGLLRCAHFVTTATDAFREHLLARFPFLDGERVRTIPNGYDDEDLVADLPSLPDDKLVLTYAGTIFRLTSARGLLGAIARLHRAEPALARRLTVRFLGRIVDTERDGFAAVDGMGVSQAGYVPHAEVRAALAASHVNLCLLDAVAGAERIYPAKIFELMAIGRPILTLAPDGALANLMRLHQLGELCAPRDEPGIAKVLERMLRDHQAGRLAARSRPIDIARFHRRALAGQFAEVLREAKRIATR